MLRRILAVVAAVSAAESPNPVPSFALIRVIRGKSEIASCASVLQKILLAFAAFWL
jgi:hypothetical protein